MGNINEFFGDDDNTLKTVDDDSSYEKKPRKISWSQFKTYQKCPHQWQLKYRDGNYIPSDSIHTIFGTSLHEALQKYLEVLYYKSVKEADRLDLEQILIDTMKEEFVKAKETYQESEHIEEGELPATYPEMKKFLMEGRRILKSFKNKRTDYFNTQKTELIGIELKVDYKIHGNIDYIGYLDVVIRDRESGVYKIIDLKTSKSGWDKWKKKDKLRVNQLVSYKMYYADLLDTDPKNIEVEYLIFKRKLEENGYFRPSRIQTYSPSSGSITQGKLRDEIESFVNEAYNSDGSRKQKEFPKKPGKFKCCFCPFSQQFDGDLPVCDQDGVKFGVEEGDKYPSGMKGYVDEKYIRS